MRSILFSVLVRFLNPVLWATALWLMIRGHNNPGGGFAAGLVASFTVILQILAGGWHSVPLKLRDALLMILGIGLSISIMSGLSALSFQENFLTGKWFKLFGVEFGTPIVFDIGIGVVVYASIVIAAGYLLAEDEEGEV